MLTCYYLPGLKRENKNELFLGKLILPTIKRCGLFWVKDILIRLDGPYATFSGLTEVPIIFAPPQQTTSVSDMTVIYHELGHSAFQYFREIRDNLAMAVYTYFSELKQKVGPISPEKRVERDRAIEEAISYWVGERLNEIFSDIYATFICGPAYYFSCVDMAIIMDGNPFHISPTDVHPPTAARVYACYRTLPPTYQNDEIVTLIQKIWNTRADNQKSPDFDIKCANDLVEEIVKTSLQNIERLLPSAQGYSKLSSNLSESKNISPSDTLETILNKRVTILLEEPTYYKKWEENVFAILHGQFQPHESTENATHQEDSNY